MWETGICGSAIGGWFWMIPLAFMALCVVMMFVGRKNGAMMGCTGMNRGDRAESGQHADEAAEDTARRRYAAGEIGREEFLKISSDLAK